VTTGPADHRLAADLAEGAGQLLVALRDELVAAGAAADTLRAEGDQRSHRYLMDQLSARAPEDAVRSEEGGPVGDLAGPRLWIVDPLDGTREFGEPPRRDWAVHVALATGGVAGVGAVALPARGLNLTTADPPTLPPAAAGRRRVVVSRTRPPAAAAPLAERLGADLVPLGSAGAKAMAVVLGEAEVYVHGGGQYEWDSAAPAAVAAAAGCHVSRLDGSPLRYGKPDPYQPDLLVCRPEMADEVLALLAELVPSPPA